MSSRKDLPTLGMLLTVALAMTNCGCGGGSATPPPIVVTVSPSSQTLDESRSVTITASVVNDATKAGVTWTLSGLLPGGKYACGNAPNNACGTLSNQTATSVTYNAPGSLQFGTINISVVATSAADSNKFASVSLTVVPPPSVTTTSLPGASGGSAYTATLQESGGVPAFSWNVSSGSLPNGFALSGSGTISGTPCTGGTSNFTVQVTDSGSPPLTASAPLSIGVTVVPLAFTTMFLPSGVTDSTYNQAVQITGGIPPYSWSVVSGSLPSWATLDSTTGSITGIPGTPGIANFTLQVGDAECPAPALKQAFSISVADATAANDSELSGQYAFLFSGFDDARGSQIAVVGSFTADGKGNITSGIEDENGPTGPLMSVPLTGTYNIGEDNLGAFTIITASGAKTYALALSSISSGVAQKARLVEFDDTTGVSGQRGSGLLRLQNPAVFSLASVNGPYVFGLAGQDTSGNRQAIIGAFNANGSGVISSGIADQNDAGAATNPSLTGTYSTPTGTEGRASMILNPSGTSSLNLIAYAVSAGELLAMTTDTVSSAGLLSGSMLSQTSASFDDTALNSPEVYYQMEVNASSPTSESFVEVGLLMPDGKGGLNVTYDNSGVRNQTFTASYSVSSSGRIITNGWYSSASPILYLVDKNQAFFLDTSPNVGFGFVEPQAAPPNGGFANSSFSGMFSAGTVAPSVSPDINATGWATLDGAGNFSESANASGPTGLSVSQTTTGSYSIASNGRATITSLTFTTAGMHGSLVFLLLLLCLLLGRLASRRNPWRSGLAIFFLALLAAPAARSVHRPPPPNQIVFYIISPTKAVVIHQVQSDATPGITILEQ